MEKLAIQLSYYGVKLVKQHDDLLTEVIVCQNLVDPSNILKIWANEEGGYDAKVTIEGKDFEVRRFSTLEIIGLCTKPLKEHILFSKHFYKEIKGKFKWGKTQQ